MNANKPQRVRISTPWYVWALALAFLTVLAGSFVSPAIGRTIRSAIGAAADYFAE